MNIKTFFLKYSDFVYKSRLRAMSINLIQMLLLQLTGYLIVLGSLSYKDVLVAFLVTLIIGVSSGNLLYELHKKKTYIK